MTDYLDELVENTNVLLEQLMRLDQGLFVGENGNFSRKNIDINHKKLSVDKDKIHVNQELNKGYELDFSRFLGETERTKESEFSEERLLQEEMQARTEKPALLEELEQAEQMSTEIEIEKTIGRSETEGEFFPFGTRRRAVALSGLTEPDENRVASLDTVRSELTAGETVDWAEQADRVFRRDSRRYDGGFCLY